MSKYKITNPYSGVDALMGDMQHHYKTNLHTHSTYSDANDTMTDMIEAFYDNDFDILAFAEHGIFGKQWDKEPSIIPLFLFQKLWHGERRHLTTEQYKAILAGTHKTKKDSRTKKRGLMSVTDAIECNMFTLVKNHVNGYFTNDEFEGVFGKENDFEVPIRAVEKSGGVSHINHPTDWLDARRYPDCGTKKENVSFFADLLRRYKSCLGIEVLNMYDIPNRCDRILWDSLLRVLIPEGERSVWGFSNSDAHDVKQVDTAFMDFILPEYSPANLRAAMENGTFFSIARYAKLELGEDFEGKGPYPTVTEIKVDDENGTITVTGINCKSIEWIADGKCIGKSLTSENGTLTSTINLDEHSDDISCYVRAQLKGDGGICLTQPFICDDGDMARLKVTLPDTAPKTKKEQLRKKVLDTRAGVIVHRMIMKKKYIK